MVKGFAPVAALAGTALSVSALLPLAAAASTPSLWRRSPVRVAQTSSSLQQDMLTVHNRYRAAVNVPPLSWSNELAQDAQQWANYLAAQGGGLQHSHQSGQGENLWAGTSGAFTYQEMADRWAQEKQYYTSGTFPAVSSTGNWFDVGHYTQMIWRDTTQVGCAVATGGSRDVLVCRYGPNGNVIGQKVF